MQRALASSPRDVGLQDFEARLLRDKRVSPFAASTGRTVVWKNGFIVAAHLTESSGLAGLLPHPAARFLRRLWLSEVRLGRMLDEGPALPHLEELVLAAQGDLALDLRKFRRLAVLELDAHGATLASLPALERLFVRTRTSSPATAAAIVKMPAQRLVELELGFEDAADTEATSSLLERFDLTALRTVRITNAPSTFIAGLLDAPFAHQLETIDLTGTWTTSTIAQLFVGRRDRLPALQQLFVEPGDAALEPALADAYGIALRAARVPRPFVRWSG